MVQSILFFTLGFLSAALIAILIAPAIRRRTATLTRKRIEATVPLTRSEVEAQVDSLRAGHAIAVRRLEMDLKAVREKAAAQSVEIGRGQEDLKKMTAAHASNVQALADMEAENGHLQETVGRHESELQQYTARLEEAGRSVEQQKHELEKLGRMYDEASFSSSNRQIELVARDAELEKLAGEKSALRSRLKEAELRHREFGGEARGLQEALKSERKKVADLDRKLGRMLSTLADREEKLDRREKELTRLRERPKARAEAASGTRDIQAEVEQGVSHPFATDQGDDVEKAIVRLGADRDRLETRLAALARENRRLRAGAAGHDPKQAIPGADDERESASLREQMSMLAAEVVHLTAKLDGPDSPIGKALAQPPGGEAEAGHVSLADRIRTLQKAAAAD